MSGHPILGMFVYLFLLETSIVGLLFEHREKTEL
jgi:hypothetical protein